MAGKPPWHRVAVALKRDADGRVRYDLQMVCVLTPDDWFPSDVPVELTNDILGWSVWLVLPETGEVSLWTVTDRSGGPSQLPFGQVWTCVVLPPHEVAMAAAMAVRPRGWYEYCAAQTQKRRN